MAHARAHARGHVRRHARHDSLFPKPVKEQIDRITDAVNRLQKDADKFQRKLAKRGKAAEREGRKQIRRLIADIRKGQVSSRLRTTRRQLEKRIEKVHLQVLSALEIPTRKDISALGRKIQALEKKISELKRSTEHAA